MKYPIYEHNLGFYSISYPISEPRKAELLGLNDSEPHHARELEDNVLMSDVLKSPGSNQEIYVKTIGLTKYVVGAKAKPPKNPRRPPKNGNVIAMNIVNAGSKEYK